MNSNKNLHNQFLFVTSGVSRGGDDSLWSPYLHPPGGCGFSPACGQMALPAEECLGWFLLYTGSPFSLASPLVWIKRLYSSSISIKLTFPKLSVPGHMCGSAGSVGVRHSVLCWRGQPHHLTGLHQPRLPGDL